MQIDGNVLIGYTDWERQKWHDWLGQHREALVRVHMATIRPLAKWVKHIFSAEKRYIESFLTNRSPMPPRFRVTTSKPFLDSGNTVGRLSRTSSRASRHQAGTS